MLTIKQNQRFAIDFRNAFERAPENRLLLLADGVVRRQRFRRGPFIGLQRFSGVSRLAPQPPEFLADEKTGDAA
jgi:hypothetical protein